MTLSIERVKELIRQHGSVILSMNTIAYGYNEERGEYGVNEVLTANTQMFTIENFNEFMEQLLQDTSIERTNSNNMSMKLTLNR